MVLVQIGRDSPSDVDGFADVDKLPLRVVEQINPALFRNPCETLPFERDQHLGFGRWGLRGLGIGFLPLLFEKLLPFHRPR